MLNRDAENDRCGDILCRDILTLCDGYGCSFLDSHGFVCTLATGHDGPHCDEFEHDGKSVVVTWHADDDAKSGK